LPERQKAFKIKKI
jgi:hypothetical protein